MSEPQYASEDIRILIEGTMKCRASLNPISKL